MLAVAKMYKFFLLFFLENLPTKMPKTNLTKMVVTKMASRRRGKKAAITAATGNVANAVVVPATATAVEERRAPRTPRSAASASSGRG